MTEFLTPEFLTTFRTTLGGAVVLLGTLFVVAGSVGVLRFPDFYTRMHAASVTDTLGATLVLGGMMLTAGWSLNSFKLLMIWVFLFMTGPAASNAAAHAALNAGLEPLLGKWTGDKKHEVDHPEGEQS